MSLTATRPPHVRGPNAAEGGQRDALIQISQLWLGIGVKAPVIQLDAIDPDRLYAELKAGNECRIEDWVVRSTPPRSVFTLDARELVTSSLWVSSPRGFTTYSPVTLAAVESACDFMATRDKRAALAYADDNSDDGIDNLD